MVKKGSLLLTLRRFGATRRWHLGQEPDNVELRNLRTESTSPRSAYLEGLYQRGRTIQHFGHLIGPLGIEYITLAHTVDWTDFAWLNQQRDLVKVVDTDTMTTWHNTAYDAYVNATFSTPRTVGSVKEMISRVEADPDGSGLFTLERFDEEPPNRRPKTEPGSLRRSEARYLLAEATTKTNEFGVVPETAGTGWRRGPDDGIELATGTLAFRLNDDRRTIENNRWPPLRTGYLASVLAACSALFAVSVRRGRRRQVA